MINSHHKMLQIIVGTPMGPLGRPCHLVISQISSQSSKSDCQQIGPADTSTLFRNVSELCSLTKRLKPPSPHHRVHTASNSQEQLLPTVNGSPQVVPSSTPRSVRLRPTQRLIPYRSQFVRYSFDVLNNASAVHVEPHDSEDDFNNNRTLLIAARIFDDELISTSSLRDINPAWSDSSASDLNRLCPAVSLSSLLKVSASSHSLMK